MTAYLLAVGIAQPPSGWLGDRYGRKRLFIASVCLFTLGSLVAALSPNLELLVASRLVQGMGGGALLPVGMAMIYELFPADRRGSAIWIWGMAAPAFGPVVGGYLVTNVSCHTAELRATPIPIDLLSVESVPGVEDGPIRQRFDLSSPRALEHADLC